jgi:hypothetical protein
MADYYPLIRKAVAGLDPDGSGESRRALYERAHAALQAQLRTTDPPFTEAEIARERLALDEAVRRVEGEIAQRTRRVPAFSDLVTGADRGKAAAEANEIRIEVPSLIVTGGATGRLTRIWRLRSHFSRGA